MPSIGVRRWLSVAAVSATVGVAALVTVLTTSVAADHLVALAGLVVVAAVARALGEGGPRSVLALAAVMLACQPLLHVLSEATQVGGDHVVALGGLVGVVQLLGHVTLLATVIAIVGTSERLGRLPIIAALRRLVRVLVSPMPAMSTPAVPTGRPQAIALAHKQRECAPEPPRRGPPFRPLSISR